MCVERWYREMVCVLSRGRDVRLCVLRGGAGMCVCVCVLKGGTGMRWGRDVYVCVCVYVC